jgi:hypothetical protein
MEELAATCVEIDHANADAWSEAMGSEARWRLLLARTDPYRRRWCRHTPTWSSPSFRCVVNWETCSRRWIWLAIREADRADPSENIVVGRWH